MTASTIAAILALAALSGLTTLIGVALATWLGQRPHLVAIGIGFSTGLMLWIALLDLVPNSWRLAGPVATLVTLLAGILLFAALHELLPHTHLFPESGAFDARLLRTGYLIAIGLVLHDLPEGFAMAQAYLLSPVLGWQIALAIGLHNIPEEFAMAAPAVTLKRRRFLYGAALVSALAEPLGAALGLAGTGLRPGAAPLFMAFAAGAMIYVSVHELLPMAALYGRRRLFAAGLLASVAVYLLIVMPGR